MRKKDRRSCVSTACLKKSSMNNKSSWKLHCWWGRSRRSFRILMRNKTYSWRRLLSQTSWVYWFSQSNQTWRQGCHRSSVRTRLVARQAQEFSWILIKRWRTWKMSSRCPSKIAMVFHQLHRLLSMMTKKGHRNNSSLESGRKAWRHLIWWFLEFWVRPLPIERHSWLQTKTALLQVKW